MIKEEKFLGFPLVYGTDFKEGIILELDGQDAATAKAKEYYIDPDSGKESCEIGDIDLVTIISKKTNKEMKENLRGQLNDLGCSGKIYIAEELRDFIEEAKKI